MLFEKIKDLKINNLHTDNWHAYDSIPKKYKPTKTKSQTSRVESSNSDLRHFIPRLIRKTKNYTKCKQMLIKSIQVFCYFFNKKLFKNLLLKKELRIFVNKLKQKGESIKNGFGYTFN